MNRLLMSLSVAAGLALLCSGCNDAPPKKVETKVETKVDSDGSKRTVKEKTVTENPDGTQTKTETKTEVKTERDSGKIIDLPGIEIRKKD